MTSSRRPWVGNVCYGDGHTELHNTFFPETLETVSSGGGGEAVNDGLFSLEGENGLDGGDVFLCLTNGGSEGNGGAEDYEHAETWD